MFIFMGMAPLSAAATGWLLTPVPLAQLFVSGGALLVGLAACDWVLTPMRRIEAQVQA